MACSTEFIDALCDLLAPLGVVRSRKMMGEYIIYVNEKCVITACGNVAYIKQLPCIAGMMQQAETAAPYPGAKEAYVLDVSDATLTLKVVATLWEHLPFPKGKGPGKQAERR